MARTKTPAARMTMKKRARVERHKKRDNSSFQTYIYKVLKQVHPDTGINTAPMQELDRLVKMVFWAVCNRIHHMLLMIGRNTISSREVQAAVRAVLPGELAKHAVSEGTKAVTKYNTKLGTGKKNRPERRERRAGLVFPVGRIEGMMRKYISGHRISETAAVYFASVLEYLTAEVLELSGNAARDGKRVRISRRDVFLAIENDEELRGLYLVKCRGVLPGGAMPYIHHSLLPKTGKKKEEHFM